MLLWDNLLDDFNELCFIWDMTLNSSDYSTLSFYLGLRFPKIGKLKFRTEARRLQIRNSARKTDIVVT